MFQGGKERGSRDNEGCPQDSFEFSNKFSQAFIQATHFSEQFSQDLSHKKNNIVFLQDIKSTLLAEVESKKLQLNMKKSSKESSIALLKSRSEEMETLLAKIKDCDVERRNQLEKKKAEAAILVKQFSTGPARYHLTKISEEIETLSRESELIGHDITTVYNPEISRLNTILDDEPVTMLDIPGSGLCEITADGLTEKLLRQREDTQELKKKVEAMMLKKADLAKKEESL